MDFCFSFEIWDHNVASTSIESKANLLLPQRSTGYTMIIFLKMFLSFFISCEFLHKLFLIFDIVGGGGWWLMAADETMGNTFTIFIRYNFRISREHEYGKRTFLGNLALISRPTRESENTHFSQISIVHLVVGGEKSKKVKHQRSITHTHRLDGRRLNCQGSLSVWRHRLRLRRNNK